MPQRSIFSPCNIFAPNLKSFSAADAVLRRSKLKGQQREPAEDWPQAAPMERRPPFKIQKAEGGMK
jgi:hypothetical protein